MGEVGDGKGASGRRNALFRQYALKASPDHVLCMPITWFYYGQAVGASAVVAIVVTVHAQCSDPWVAVCV